MSLWPRRSYRHLQPPCSSYIHCLLLCTHTPSNATKTSYSVPALYCKYSLFFSGPYLCWTKSAGVLLVGSGNPFSYVIFCIAGNIGSLVLTSFVVGVRYDGVLVDVSTHGISDSAAARCTREPGNGDLFNYISTEKTWPPLAIFFGSISL